MILFGNATIAAFPKAPVAVSLTVYCLHKALSEAYKKDNMVHRGQFSPDSLASTFLFFQFLFSSWQRSNPSVFCSGCVVPQVLGVGALQHRHCQRITHSWQSYIEGLRILVETNVGNLAEVNATSTSGRAGLRVNVEARVVCDHLGENVQYRLQTVSGYHSSMAASGHIPWAQCCHRCESGHRERGRP